MSDLSVFLHSVSDFFNAHPDPTVQAAGTQLRSAAGAVEQALPVIAAEAVEAGLGKLGPIGQASSPFFGLAVEGLVAALVAKKPAAA
jgi:hypothetical protein